MVAAPADLHYTVPRHAGVRLALDGALYGVDHVEFRLDGCWYQRPECPEHWLVVNLQFAPLVLYALYKLLKRLPRSRAQGVKSPSTLLRQEAPPVVHQGLEFVPTVELLVLDSPPGCLSQQVRCQVDKVLPTQAMKLELWAQAKEPTLAGAPERRQVTGTDVAGGHVRWGERHDRVAQVRRRLKGQAPGHRS